MRITHPDEVRQLIETDDNDQDVVDILARSGALVRGHFELISGRHSQYFLRFSELGWDRSVVARIASQLLQKCALASRPDAVLCPSTAGLLLAFPLAKELGARLVVSRVDMQRRPAHELEEGKLSTGESVLLVNDVITSGSSLRRLSATASGFGARVIGAAVFAALNLDLPGQVPSVGPVSWLVRARWPTYATQDCPGCREGAEYLVAGELN